MHTQTQTKVSPSLSLTPGSEPSIVRVCAHPPTAQVTVGDAQRGILRLQRAVLLQE